MDLKADIIVRNEKGSSGSVDALLMWKKRKSKTGTGKRPLKSLAEC